MYEYKYDGPVLKFGDCIKQRWKAVTIAPTEAKARSNLAYRFKKENGFMKDCKISLPGKFIRI